MTTRIGVVAHTARLRQAEQLADKVGAEVLSFDDGMLGCNKNHIKVWTNLLQRGGDWLVVLEDDAVPVDGFREQLDLALASAPTRIVGLYLGTGHPKAWQRFIKKAMSSATANYVLSTHLLHSVAVAMRPELVYDMLQMISWLTEEEKKWPVDEQITHWARQRGNDIAYTKPSLVDHADGPSLVPDTGTRDYDLSARRAWETGTRTEWIETATVRMP